MSASSTGQSPAFATRCEPKRSPRASSPSDFYARIENRNPELNAYLALSPDRAYAQADRIDAAIAKGDALPPLAGVPIAVKDVISTRGISHDLWLEDPRDLRPAL